MIPSLATIGGNAAPEITTNEDAQEEVNRKNVFRLAVIGAKEQIAKEITAQVGKSVTDPILRNVDGVNFKKVDEYHLHQLITAVMEGAERPDPIEIRKQITDVMGLVFDWHETGATNQERLAADIVKTAAFGIVIGHDIKAAIILANIVTAARHSSGGTEIAEAQRKIRAIYAYNHAHDDASIKLMMKEIATGDKQRDRTAISGPNRGIAGSKTNFGNGVFVIVVDK